MLLLQCVWYRTHLSYQITISIDMLQMCDGVSIKKTITPHTATFLLCHAFHPCIAENGVLNDKTKMSYHGMVGLR